MTQKLSIALVGVGGQGVITAANILGKAAIQAKVNVFVSEIHGMAQRGGTVICSVRIGNVTSPLMPQGTADIILSTEPIEALRYLTYGNKNTKIITDINPVIPFTVSVSGEKYPDLKTVFTELDNKAQLYKIDALQIARDAGAIITKNIVMLGALAATKQLPFKTEILLDTIMESIPQKYQDINKKAFQNGMQALIKK